MIKKYRNQKLQQLAFGIILFALYAIVMQDFTSSLAIVAILTLIIAMGFNTSLIYEIQIEERDVEFKTYSLLSKQEVLKIEVQDIIDLKYDDTFFSSYNLILIYKANDKPIKKRLYLNAEPWNDIMIKLREVHQLIPKQ